MTPFASPCLWTSQLGGAEHSLGFGLLLSVLLSFRPREGLGIFRLGIAFAFPRLFCLAAPPVGGMLASHKFARRRTASVARGLSPNLIVESRQATFTCRNLYIRCMDFSLDCSLWHHLLCCACLSDISQAHALHLVGWLQR